MEHSTAARQLNPAEGEPQQNRSRELVRALIRNREELLQRIFDGRHVGRLAAALLALNVTLLAAYGAVMGLSAHPDTVAQQVASSAVKLPLLYLLTLAVCLPVLHVLNVLLGSKLGFLQTVTLFQVAIGLNAILAACCAPIAAFFQATGSDYNFMKLLHVAVLGFAGLWGMGALYKGLYAMCEHSSVYPRHAMRILLLWLCVYGFVGTQMAWTLRPFLGAPDQPFEILRGKDSPGNFYQAVAQALEGLD